ncbi:hypothetical protein ACIRUY_25360 [Streptomyces erythrochromogenes]|uniref:hypothetical protein n=1 Tax=Streptomyces erythrochromogenes TaxID=285574 RepID=UPI00381814F2
MHEKRPEPVRPTQWLAWAALQVWFTPFGIYSYGDMTKPPWNVETGWALGFAAVLIAIPTVYGLALTEQSFARRRYDERVRRNPPGPYVPSCEGCNARPCSWNTRTSEWMDTCSGCRGDQYFDNDHMIG